MYRQKQKSPEFQNKIVILIDDRASTGLTILASIKALEKYNHKEVVVAVPVGSKAVYNQFKQETEEVVFINLLDDFYAVGQAYENFSQVSDEEVQILLEQ
ncbi:phosphoribosyltransferase family protein [Wolbachia pipientis]|uniref:phosphoribosyltransferase family protein n=1 Tax=Wolbachia pipientis TaxID=955 RepID=UPI0021BE06FE|nr:phosphoribosyltransferase family protein [Wolbachia pipientis]